MLKLAVFDMDGLIFDTERLFMDILRPVMQKDGYSLSEENYVSILGLAHEACRKRMTDMYGEDYPYERHNDIVRLEISKIAEKGELPIKKGIRALLEFLKESNVKCAVASSTDSVFVKKYIESAGLGDFFDVIIGGDMAKNSKPAPDIFLKACEICGIAPDSAVVFEDSDNGIRAALNGNIRVICIPDMKQPEKSLKDKLFALCKDGFEARDLLTKIKF